MNKSVHPFQPHDEIRAEARRWVLRFNGDQPPTGADIAGLREWSARSPAHRAELERAQAFWSDADMLTGLAVPTVREQVSRPRRWMAGPRMGAMAAALLVCVISVLAWQVWYPMQDPARNGRYATQIGEQKTLVLADNSRIRLDTDSEVRVEYTPDYRELYLMRGKAYFEVAKDAARPFEVYAGEGMVRAVGTAFSVYLVEKNVEVTVTEGKVDLLRLESPPPDKTAEASGNSRSRNSLKLVETRKRPAAKTFRTLEVGQSATFDSENEQVRDLEETEISRDLAWREGVLIFTGEPLSQVIAEVNRYTTTRIEVADPALGNLMIGGRFKVGRLEALFDVLQTGFGVQVSYVDENHVRLEPSPQSL